MLAIRAGFRIFACVLVLAACLYCSISTYNLGKSKKKSSRKKWGIQTSIATVVLVIVLFLAPKIKNIY